MKRNSIFLFYFLFCSQVVFAEKTDCEKITSFLNQKEKQIEHLNLYDPDYIPLHYFIAQDIIKEFKQFRNEVIPFFAECSTITFSELINKYDELVNRVQIKHDSLAWLSENVHLIFYEKALYEYKLKNEEDAKYLLDRSLQYNETFPDAILLKLNKLLDVNAFEECLLLLNTLYYETQMDREQEKQAIVFTDKFYGKLYKTGDSLVKKEHAAEALVLFELLEVFCLNLPTAYCNDDYYHGVLRSKSGIYESYVAIAKVAEKRGNHNIATHFYEYAKEYLKENPHLGVYMPENKTIEKNEPIKKIETIETIKKNESIEKIEIVEIDENVIIETITIVGKEVTDVLEIPELIINQENTELQLSPKEIKEKYDKMVLQALALCIKDDFPESYKMFKEAKKLEECNCFDKDFRVDLMLKELFKIIH